MYVKKKNAKEDYNNEEMKSFERLLKTLIKWRSKKSLFLTRKIQIL